MTSYEDIPLKIMLAGISGSPGKQIYSALKALPETRQLSIAVLKRQSHQIDHTDQESFGSSNIVYVDYNEPSTLEAVVRRIEPHLVISALHAEPSPSLDDTLLSAVIGAHLQPAPLFITGYTLDVMHPSARALASGEFLTGKIALATRLQAAAAQGTIRYTTIVNAGFLDYILAKGYTGIDFKNQKATLFDDGVHRATGCTLDFIGACVAEVVRDVFFRGDLKYINRRLRLAETPYTGRELLQLAQKVTGSTDPWPITHVNTDERIKEGQQLLQTGEPGRAVSCFFSKLVWGGTGAACFEDGLEVMPDVPRRSLETIVQHASENLLY